MDFFTLWERSRALRTVFKANGIINADQAHPLWYCRHPELEWRLCPVKGCSRIAVDSDQFCMEHITKRKKRLPEWLFIRGRLCRYTPVRIGHAGETRARDYRDFALSVSEKSFGRIEVGYGVHFIDGNFLNCHHTNLVHLTHISRIAMDNIRLPMPTAIRIDGRIHDLITGQKGRAQAAAIVAYGHIAKATGLTLSAVRMAVHRGEFAMNDADSVLEYVLRKVEERRNECPR